MPRGSEVTWYHFPTASSGAERSEVGLHANRFYFCPRFSVLHWMHWKQEVGGCWHSLCHGNGKALSMSMDLIISLHCPSKDKYLTYVCPLQHWTPPLSTYVGRLHWINSSRIIINRRHLWFHHIYNTLANHFLSLQSRRVNSSFYTTLWSLQ